MAEPEVDAVWRAEFKRIGEQQLRDALNSGSGFTDEPSRRRNSVTRSPHRGERKTSRDPTNPEFANRHARISQRGTDATAAVVG